MSKDKNTDDLKTIIPTDDDLVVKLENRDVVVSRIKVKQLPVVMEVLTPLLHYFKDSDIENLDVNKIMMENIEGMILLTKALTDLDYDEVDNLEMDEAIKVFSRVVEVNLDFFIQKVKPVLLEVMERASNLKK